MCMRVFVCDIMCVGFRDCNLFRDPRDSRPVPQWSTITCLIRIVRFFGIDPEGEYYVKSASVAVDGSNKAS